MADAVDTVRVSQIVDSSYETEPNIPAWVTEAFDKDDFLLVNTTVRLKVGKDEVYATYKDSITRDEDGKYGVIRGEFAGVHG
jgi:hypothetical protein